MAEEEEATPAAQAQESEKSIPGILANSQSQSTRVQSVSAKPSASVKISMKSVNTNGKSSCSRSLKRKKPKRRKCIPRTVWECSNYDPWRMYMMTMVDDVRIREEEDMAKYGDLSRDRWPQRVCCLQWPGIEESKKPLCAKLNLFNQEVEDQENQETKEKFDTSKMWKALCNPCKQPDPTKIDYSVVGEAKWPKLWPCWQHDLIRKMKIKKRKEKMKRMGALPCEIDDIDSPESSDDERLHELAKQKELGHVRIPLTYYKKGPAEKVDQAIGDAPGLVNGDTILLFFLASKKGPRTYANVCLRGLEGMHLAELERSREKTWKFCLFQALVALLVKTQLRYKYAWAANIDYIYQHAWLIFLHVGFLNLSENQRFDDILVYNYKYSVELELIQEICDVLLPTSASFKYVENALTRQRGHRKREITFEKAAFGEEKTMDCFKRPVHFTTRELERWFDELEPRFTNCVLRTSRFCLAFWQDGPFWYTYNPYRCDKYGFWSEAGAACLVKFCSKESLKRYLVVMIIRAYAYAAIDQAELERRKCVEKMTRCAACKDKDYCQPDRCKRERCRPGKCHRDRCTADRCPAHHCGKECPKDKCQPSKCPQDPCKVGKLKCAKCKRERCMEGCKRAGCKDDQKRDWCCEEECCEPEPVKFSAQIYQLIFHSCQIHNVKLYMRKPFKPRPPMVEKKPSDPCTFDPHAHLTPKVCPDSDNENPDEFDEKMEKPHWVRDGKITWTKLPKNKEDKDREKWHNFDVIVPNRLYVLWGDIHLSDRIFAEENRNRQVFASYAVAAGMSLINTPEYWDNKVINAILVCGDRLYAKRKLKKPKNTARTVPEQDNWDDRPQDYFRIGETLFEVEALPPVEGSLYHRNEESLWRRLERLFQSHRFAVLTCEQAMLGLLKHCGAYYLCDFRSYGPPSFERGTGHAHMLRLACFRDLVRSAVLIVDSPECSGFSLRPIEIGRIVDATDDECGRDRTVCQEVKRPCDDEHKPRCPIEEEMRKARGMKRKAMEEKKDIDAYTCCER